MNWKSRIGRFALLALKVSYVIIGLLFIITFTPGGIALGVAFLGGALLLYGGVELLRRLAEITALLRILAYRKKSEAHHEVAPDAGLAARPVESKGSWLRDA